MRTADMTCFRIGSKPGKRVGIEIRCEWSAFRAITAMSRAHLETYLCDSRRSKDLDQAYGVIAPLPARVGHARAPRHRPGGAGPQPNRSLRPISATRPATTPRPLSRRH